ncbi:MAG TPA: DUF802 domain-containing protein, partial [Burkholderiaceae bacterium]|nr:DUF802 domain-containing protein [Burkholderiaceae bacterium]
MNRSLRHAAFLLGLIAVCWVGVGYVRQSPLALAVLVLIGAFYLLGARELHRFNQATSSLSKAVADTSDPPASLVEWLGGIPSSLRNAVRLRVEGEHVALPGPAMTPYLVGFLVLLGMLGTFLGMVATLAGTGMALESAVDLQAIRASLAAPVKGLGLAFGTSVAGVAASAALGLMSALSRSERLQASQLLDAKIATTLRAFSAAHQRDESFKLLQLQAQAMPRLIEHLQAMMTGMERQSETLSAQLKAGQDDFHSRTERVFTDLARSVDRSLRDSLLESAGAAGATIKPVVEATMAAIARETSGLHEGIAKTVQCQLEGTSSRFEATTTAVADIWKAALARQGQRDADLLGDLRQSLDKFAETFEQRSATLVDTVSQANNALHGEMASTMSGMARETASLQQRMADSVTMQLDGLSTRFDGAVTRVSDTWGEALAHHQHISEAVSNELHQALTMAAASFEQRSESLVQRLDEAHVELQRRLASADERRLDNLTQALASMAESLRLEWQQAGAQTLGQQQAICQTLERTALDVTEHAQASARSTIAEVGRLLEAAAEAPRAAAEVIAEVRQKLADSVARDNAALEEHARLMQTLQTLLDVLAGASGEQRAAVEAFVESSSALLERAGARFGETVDAQTEKMSGIAAQVVSSTVEAASLGEAFGLAVQLFSQSNEKLVAHLQRIEAALNKSITRSDEQLGYYVAQAREIIDL